MKTIKFALILFTLCIFSSNLYARKQGVVRLNGDTIIPISPRLIEYTCNGVFKISETSEEIDPWKSDLKWGLIDEKGNEILPIKYKYELTCYRDSLVRISESPTIFMNLQGDTILNVNGLSFGGFSSEGLLRIDESYFIDKRGNVVIPKNDKTFYRGGFCNGLAAMIDLSSGTFGFIDKNGTIKFRLPSEIKDAFSFNEFGFCIVRSNESYGVVNKKGEYVVPCQFLKISWNEEIEAYECFDGDSTLYMAKNGKLQTEKPSRQQSVPQQKYVINSREVNGSKKYGLTDNQGNCILDCTYDKITYLGDDYFLFEDFS